LCVWCDQLAHIVRDMICVFGVTSLRALFVALNDEERVVRGLAIMVVGRLALRNPAYVMPALRRHLMQLLNDMNTAQDYSQREGAKCTYHNSFNYVF
jgi:hypothetical protein